MHVVESKRHWACSSGVSMFSISTSDLFSYLGSVQFFNLHQGFTVFKTFNKCRWSRAVHLPHWWWTWRPRFGGGVRREQSAPYRWNDRIRIFTFVMTVIIIHIHAACNIWAISRKNVCDWCKEGDFVDQAVHACRKYFGPVNQECQVPITTLANDSVRCCWWWEAAVGDATAIIISESDRQGRGLSILEAQIEFLKNVQCRDFLQYLGVHFIILKEWVFFKCI